MPTNRLIVGITGASGTAYGIRVLEAASALGIETHLIMTRSAKVTLVSELSTSVSEVEALATHVHKVEDIAAPVSSGSFQTMGMIVAPCSIRSLSEIAYGVTSNLLTRAADVVLKERRRLVLLVRETPLHTGHLRTMVQASEIGAIIMPPVPALYTRPTTIDQIVDHTVGRAMDLFGLDTGSFQRWGEGKRPPGEDR